MQRVAWAWAWLVATNITHTIHTRDATLQLRDASVHCAPPSILPRLMGGRRRVCGVLTEKDKTKKKESSPGEQWGTETDSTWRRHHSTPADTAASNRNRSHGVESHSTRHSAAARDRGQHPSDPQSIRQHRRRAPAVQPLAGCRSGRRFDARTETLWVRQHTQQAVHTDPRSSGSGFDRVASSLVALPF